MITSTTTNYTFRKVDLSLYPDLRSAGIPVGMRLGSPARLITGHSKAAQNFLRVLMTPLGHYRSRPDFGSEFSTKIFSGSMIFAEDLPNIFAMESLRVLEQVFDPKSESIPSDEIIIRADLKDFRTSPGTLVMEIYLYFRNETEPKSIRLPIILDQVS